MKTVYLAAGCFWGVEHKFSQIPGVVETQVGYMNGKTENPTYKQVCTDTTGHVEAVKVLFDPNQVTLEQLLSEFWQLHDPTTLNRQGPDHGSQYRSGIYLASPDQEEIAQTSKETKQVELKDKIVTEIKPADRFYPAEEYHQKYFVKNGGHCSF